MAQRLRVSSRRGEETSALQGPVDLGDVLEQSRISTIGVSMFRDYRDDACR